MGGCMTGSAARHLQTPAYQLILNDIYELVPREEQMLKFTKKSEIMKYVAEYQWDIIAGQFKQYVKTLIDHIESYKIRLVDTAIYIENKIVYHYPYQKLTQNPIILKMSMLILQELVQHLQKFIQQVQLSNQNDMEMSQRSIQPENLQTMTYVSDNFLKFELTFSGILSYLINSKQLYNLVWWDYLMASLTLFANKSTKQFQSENIQSIISFLEYIIGIKLTNKDLFEPLFQSQDDQQALSELLDYIKEPLDVLVVYNETLTMIPSERLFQTKNQRLLFRILIKDYSTNNSTLPWHQTTETFIMRSLNQQQFEDLFTLFYMEEANWNKFDNIQIITKLLLNTAKQCDQTSDIEIFLITKLMDQLSSTQQPVADSPNSRQKQSNQNTQIVKLLAFIFSNLESSQFVLFQQNTIIKGLLNNLKNVCRPDLFQDSKQCILIILKLISHDANALESFIYQLLQFTYNLQQFNQQNSNLVNQLLQIIEECEYAHNPRDETLYLLIDLGDCNQQALNSCSTICAKMLTSQVVTEDDMNASLFIPNPDILSLTAYQIVNALIASKADTQLYNLFIKFAEQKLRSVQILSLIAYLVDSSSYNQNVQQQSSKSKQSAVIDFDGSINKVMQMCLILKLIAILQEDSMGNDLNSALYAALGSQFQTFKRQGLSAYTEIQALLGQQGVNSHMSQIFFVCFQQTLVDFDRIRQQFKENIHQLQNSNGVVNIDDIMIKEEGDRQQLFQSFHAPSQYDIEFDQGFEQVLQTIKKQKMKQDKLANISYL